MGSYLSEPITEKISIEEVSEKLLCGASSMQGWRVSQEDAHNCLLDFDKDTALFAVYDGHGGHEVALYCSQKLPEFLKALQLYKSGDIEKALEAAFLGFDASIATPEIVTLLKEMAKDRDSNDDSDEDEENVQNLYKEAEMPIEQVIEKYTNNLLHPVKSLKEDSKFPSSPLLKAKGKDESSSSACASSSSTSEVATSACSSSTSTPANVANISEPVSSSTAKAEVPTTKVEEEETVEKHENGHKVPDIVVDSIAHSTSECTKTETDDDAHNNGAVITSSAATPMENGSPSKKGKALTKTKGVDKSPQESAEKKSTRPKRSVEQIYAKLLDFNADDSEDDSEDENDKTFEGPTETSDDDGEGVNASIEGYESGDEDDDDDDEDEEDSDDDDENGEDDEAAVEFARNMVEEPGSDSGCTAVVALLKEDTLYVANAGDSRCIVCRNGKAVDMSFDHKPEDQIERDRIVKAGGRVTADGRVNGGLNLSRAIGDHAYKQNKELSDREQMITALPDIKTLKIDPTTDEFMVLACDGIWNFMSSQEVVDFVLPGIHNGTKLAKICEEMFDHCLAPNTMGDGTGCDNMTAIIVQFRNATVNLKRQVSSDAEENDNTKRAKTEEDPSTTSTS